MMRDHACGMTTHHDTVQPPRCPYEVANQFGWSRDELELYDYWDIKAQDERGAIEAAEAKGRAEGQQEKAQEIARNLLAEGIDPATIARITGLSGTDMPT